VFKLVGASASDPKLVAARNGVKRLRTVRGRQACRQPGLTRRGLQLRHPLLLQYKDSVELEADKAGAVTLYLVTEAVQPLATLLQELQLQGSQRCAGLLLRVEPAPLTRWLPQRRVHCLRPGSGGSGGCLPERGRQDGAQLSHLPSLPRPSRVRRRCTATCALLPWLSRSAWTGGCTPWTLHQK